LGDPIKVTPELAFGMESVSLFMNGEEVGSGSGAAILGDPVKSVLNVVARTAGHDWINYPAVSAQARQGGRKVL
jgi:2-keto-4-pentenoate hydratase